MNKLFTITLIALTTSVFAQDQIAKEILDKLSATTKSYKNMTVSFDFILENKSQDIREIQSGLLVLGGDNFRLEMEEQTIINDGESQWVYLADMNEVQIMEHDPEDEMMSLNKLFTIYEEGYKYTYIGASSKNGKRLQLIELYPEESGEFMKIKLSVDAAKNKINSIAMHDKHGGTYTYLVKSFKSNTEIEPFTFNSSEFPNVEVIDLR